MMKSARRLSRRENTRIGRRERRRGEKLLKTIREVGGLPERTPESPQPRPMRETPHAESPDLLQDFAQFGSRVTSLIATAREREALVMHATPDPVIYSEMRDQRPRRRSRRHAATPEIEFGSAASAPDRAAASLAIAGVGLAVFLTVAVLTVTLRAPSSSRPIAKRPLPEPVEAPAAATAAEPPPPNGD